MFTETTTTHLDIAFLRRAISVYIDQLKNKNIQCMLVTDEIALAETTLEQLK